MLCVHACTHVCALYMCCVCMCVCVCVHICVCVCAYMCICAFLTLHAQKTALYVCPHTSCFREVKELFRLNQSWEKDMKLVSF